MMYDDTINNNYDDAGGGHGVYMDGIRSRCSLNARVSKFVEWEEDNVFRMSAPHVPGRIVS